MREINQEVRRTKSHLGIFQRPTKARSPKFSLAEAKQIRWLYEHGDYSIRGLARRFKCAPQTINNILLGRSAYRELGVKKAKRQRPPLTDEEKRKIRRLEWEDYSRRAIAEEMECSVACVCAVLRDFDVD